MGDQVGHFRHSSRHTGVVIVPSRHCQRHLPDQGAADPDAVRALLIVGASVVVLIVGSIVGSDTGSNQSPTSAQPRSEATTTTTTRIAATTTTTTKPPPKRAGIGDPVRDGKFEFVVIDVEQPGKILGSGGLEDEALGTWLIVRIKVTNVSDEAQSFFASNQKLTLGAATYDAASFTWSGTALEDLNPGLSFEAIVPFDVPESFPRDGTGAVLTLHDSAFSGGVEVWL